MKELMRFRERLVSTEAENRTRVILTAGQAGAQHAAPLQFSELSLRYLATIDLPGKRAALPSSSSMRSSWLYFAMRSVREAEPVLIWPAPVATARSAIKVSSVSPERWEMMELKPALRASSMASMVSVTLPI